MMTPYSISPMPPHIDPYTGNLFFQSQEGAVNVPLSLALTYMGHSMSED